MARPNLTTHRKFLRLATAIGGSKVLARGILETLWAPCYEAGDPYLGTSDDVEALCEWKGLRGDLTHALLEAGAPRGAGFIEPYAGTVRDATQPHYQVHDLFQNAPGYVSSRFNREQERNTPKICETCRAQYFAARLSRFCSVTCRSIDWRKRKRSIKTGLDAPVPAPRATDATRATDRNATPAPAPAHVRTSTVRPRTLASSELAQNASSEPPIVEAEMVEDDVQNPEVARPDQKPQKRRKPIPPPDASPVVLTFPVVGKGGPTWSLVESQVIAWQALYPELDIVGLARQALAWVDANWHRRKSVVGMPAFLVAWFNRSSDRRSGVPNVMTGSLKTAGNRAALERFVRGGS